jgi:hypothetical protein
VLIVQAAWAWDRGRRLRRTRKKNTVSCGSSTGSEATKSIFIVERGGIAQGSEKRKQEIPIGQLKKTVSRQKETEKAGIRHQWWLTRPSDLFAVLTFFFQRLSSSVLLPF